MSTPTPSRLPGWAAALLTFIAAASVLVLEIAAGRLLAPFVGVSLTTYTGIIGVVLAGIALGAWLGGRAADRFGPERLLGPTLAAGGIAAMASIPIVDAVGSMKLGAELGGIVALSAAGFVLPATILSAVGPMIVRASLTDLGTSGSLVGRLSAIGTAGAITGTFLTGFVLLGLVPTRPLIAGVGTLVVGVGVVTSLAMGRLRSGAVVGLIGFLAGAGLVAASGPSPCFRESAYYCVTITSDPASPNRRTLVLDGVRHSFVDTADPSVLGFRYVRWFVDASATLTEARGGEVDVLHIGGGGFSLPRYLAAEYPASRHTILELDPVVLATARSELGFAETDRTSVIVGDARTSAAGLPDGYDLVFGDAFGSLSVPWHLTTREFLVEVDRLLRPGGLYLINVIDFEPLPFARAETATLRSVFEHVVVIAGGSPLAGSGGGNLVLVASHEPIDAEDLLAQMRANDDGTAALLSLPSDLDLFTAGSPLLTDDFAPVDQMLSR